MKKLRKIGAMICLVAVMACSLVGCGKKTCDVCGKKKSGVKTEKVLGIKVNICKDCQKNPLSGLGF